MNKPRILQLFLSPAFGDHAKGPFWTLITNSLGGAREKRPNRDKKNKHGILR